MLLSKQNGKVNEGREQKSGEFTRQAARFC
jgi:hypothetical protein